MHFELTPSQQRLRRDVIVFGRRLSMECAGAGPSGEFRVGEWKECAAFGIQGLPFPVTYGGGGHDALTTIIAMEALGVALRDNGLLFGLAAQMSAVQMPIARFGSDEQRRKYLQPLCRGEMIGAHAMTEPQAGSDAFALSTRAVRRGDAYVLNGSKLFVSQAPVADAFVLFATVEADASVLGITAFLVDRATQGVHVGPLVRKAGLDSAPMASVTLEDVEVPISNRLGREGRGAEIFLDAMEWERIMIMATGVGALDRQFEDLIAASRTGGRIATTSHGTLVDLRVRLEIARLVLYRAAWAKVHDDQARLYSSMAKLVISDAMLRGALDALDLGGLEACLDGQQAERDLRDALAAPIYSGTAEVQRRAIARALGLRAD